MEYIAFDAHKHHTLASVARPDGHLVREERVEHNRGALRHFLERCEQGSPVAVETIGNWNWIVDEIEAAGCLPKLVHARKAKLMMGMINKTDKLDARGLNQLQRNGTLPTVWIPPGELRDQRDLPRTRMVLVRQRVRGFEQRMRTVFKVTPQIQLLMTVPGVGLILAVLIALEVGDVARFATAEKLAANLRATLGFPQFAPTEPELPPLHRASCSWAGIRLLVPRLWHQGAHACGEVALDQRRERRYEARAIGKLVRGNSPPAADALDPSVRVRPDTAASHVSPHQRTGRARCWMLADSSGATWTIDCSRTRFPSPLCSGFASV
jgi:hypothetical protein